MAGGRRASSRPRAGRQGRALLPVPSSRPARSTMDLQLRALQCTSLQDCLRIGLLGPAVSAGRGRRRAGMRHDGVAAWRAGPVRPLRDDGRFNGPATLETAAFAPQPDDVNNQDHIFSGGT